MRVNAAATLFVASADSLVLRGGSVFDSVLLKREVVLVAGDAVLVESEDVDSTLLTSEDFDVALIGDVALLDADEVFFAAEGFAATPEAPPEGTLPEETVFFMMMM